MQTKERTATETGQKRLKGLSKLTGLISGKIPRILFLTGAATMITAVVTTASPEFHTQPLTRTKQTQPETLKTQRQEEFMTEQPAEASSPADKYAPSQSSSSQVITTVNGDNATTDITINGKKVEVPEDGEVHRRTESSDGFTQLDIKVQNNTVNDSSSSSVNVHVESNSSATTQ